jgi:5-methylcytosine-specific restriction enzyme A
MPIAPPVACRCGKLDCKEHTARRVFDQERRDDPLRAIYNTRRWRFRTRPYILSRDPLCKIAKVCVATFGAPLPSNDVDHVIPIRAGGAPWDENNLQGACHLCHSAKTAEERLAA